MAKLQFAAAGLALVFAFCTAFTSANSNQTNPNATEKWGVNPTTDGAYYILEQDVTGQPEAYNCNASSHDCTVLLDPADIVQRNNHYEVLATKAIVQEQGDFTSM